MALVRHLLSMLVRCLQPVSPLARGSGSKGLSMCFCITPSFVLVLDQVARVEPLGLREIAKQVALLPPPG